MEAVFWFPARSLARFAGTLTVTVPGTSAVIVNVYVSPSTAVKPEMEPLLTTTSEESKPVTVSLNWAVTPKVAVLVVPEPPPDRTTVGGVVS